MNDEVCEIDPEDGRPLTAPELPQVAPLLVPDDIDRDVRLPDTATPGSPPVLDVLRPTPDDEHVIVEVTRPPDVVTFDVVPDFSVPEMDVSLDRCSRPGTAMCWCCTGAWPTRSSRRPARRARTRRPPPR